MKIVGILSLALLSSGALAAQDYEPKLDAQLQVFGELVRPYSIVLPFSGADPIKDQPGHQVGLGLRLLGEMPELPHVYYEFAGKLPSHSNLSTQSTVSGSSVDLTGVRISHSYFSFGGAYILPVGLMQIGGHLEGRYEHVKLDGSYSYAGTAAPVALTQTYVRPWVRLSANALLGSSPDFRSIIGVDVAAALTRTRQASATPDLWDEHTARSMAPRWSASIFAGVLF